MEWPEVLRRIEGGENSHTEFKRGLGEFSKIGKRSVHLPMAMEGCS